VADSRGITTYSYDVMDRLTQVVNPDGSSLSYTYDAVGNRTSVTVLSGATTYTYDALNRLATVTDPGVGVTTYTYDNVGNRASITYPNGTITQYTYDALNRLIRLENLRSDSSVISSYDYTLGPAGNRMRVIENTGRTVDYTYDALYRLVEENITDPILSNQTISYTYDPVGNRLTKTDANGTTNYTYDANDRLITEGSNTYTYDNNGNNLSKTEGFNTTTYTYDYENRLISAQTPSSALEYNYDSDGIRVSSIVDGVMTNYLVDKNRYYAQVLEELDNSGTLAVSYVYGDDLISQDRDGKISYYIYDGQLSTRQLIDFSESITDTYVFDAFGIELNRTGTTTNSYLYTGEQYDPNVGFYYLRARYYNPSIGRFQTLDTYAGNMFEPLSLHKYLYAHADPVNNTDPSGMFTLVELGTVILLIMIGIAVISSIAVPLFKSAARPPGIIIPVWNAVNLASHIAMRLSINIDLCGVYYGEFYSGTEFGPIQKEHRDSWAEISAAAGSVVDVLGMTPDANRPNKVLEIEESREGSYKIYATNDFKDLGEVGTPKLKRQQVALIISALSKQLGLVWDNYPETSMVSRTANPPEKRIPIFNKEDELGVHAKHARKVLEALGVQ
jgi:RHS repeat-associated protein